MPWQSQIKSRWTLPAVVYPAKVRRFVVCVPDEPFYVAAFQGLLIELTYSKNWQRDPAHTAALVTRHWQDILNDVTCDIPGSSPANGGADGDETLIRQNPTNPCELQTSVDGLTWCTFADFSLCLQTGINQPGSGAEQPAPNGGEACYNGKVSAAGRFLVPTPVSTGDEILINVQGSGTDGSAYWYCPNGDTFFAGLCGGIPQFDPSDPVPAAPHMAFVIDFAGTFYEIPLGAPSFTVPAGVAGVQPVLQVNDSTLSDNAGEYTIDVCVTNNATTQFTHHFDFRLGTFGWQQNLFGGNSNAVWTAGAGFSSSIINASPLAGEGTIDIHLAAPRVLANMVLRLVGYTDSGTPNGQALYLNPGGFPPQNVGEVYGQNVTGAVDFSHAFTNSDDDLAMQIVAGATIGQACTLTDAYVTADGSDPF